MDELTAFITARLDEDERNAPMAGGFAWRSGYPKERLQREVAAKRAIMAEHSPHWPVYFPQPSGQPMCCVCDEGGFDPSPVDWPCPTVRHLAAIWSDHPDCRQEWVTDIPVAP